jgi:MFS family permease
MTRSLVLFYLAGFFQGIPQGVIPPLLPPIGADLHLSLAEVGLIPSVFALTRLASDLPAGLLAGRLGSLRLMVTGMSLGCLGNTAAALAPNFTILLVGRGVGGAGHGLHAIGSILALTSAVPSAHRGRAMSLLEVTSLSGFIVAAPVGGLLAEGIGWRAALAFGAASSFCSLAACLLSSRAGFFGRPGREAPAPGPATAMAAPAIPAPGGRWRTYVALNLVAFAYAFSWAGILNTVVPLHADRDLGMKPRAIGSVVSVCLLTDVAFQLAAGRLGDRIGRHRLIAPMLALQVVGSLLATLSAGPGLLWLAAVILGLGYTGWMTPAALLGDLTTGARRGRALSWYRFSLDLAAVASPAILGALLDPIGFAGAGFVTAGVLALAWTVNARWGVGARR